jgi:hypothetical protein
MIHTVKLLALDRVSLHTKHFFCFAVRFTAVDTTCQYEREIRTSDTWQS